MTDQGARGDYGSQCEGHGDERLEAEGEVALARVIMDGGDLQHAADHLGGAMATDPRLPEAYEALTELALRAGGVLAAVELFPMEKPFIGTVACRAHLLASAEDWDTAFELLAMVIAVDPDRAYAHAAWLLRPELPARLSPDAVTRAAAKLTRVLDDPMEASTRDSVAPFYAVVRGAAAAHSGDAALLAMASSLARRSGDVDDAIAFAARAREVALGYMPSVMLGSALRAAGRVDDAIAVWAEELQRDGSDTYLPVDIAELYAATGRPAQGLPWVEQVLAVDPTHEKAAPAALAIRYQMDGDVTHLVALADHLREFPDHYYAGQLLAQMCRGVDWLGSVASATEATVNVLRQALEDGGPTRDSGIHLAISAIEPPSALIAFRTAFPNSEVEFQSIDEPDPRLPVTEVTASVWQYDGLIAAPTVAPPSDSSAALLRDIAQTNWPHLPAAYDHAIALAGLPLEDLRGLLVHPPRPRDDEQGQALASYAPDFWIRSVQTFACLGIAHHRTDEPWADSVRRAVLYDLLSGPEDWVSEAAGAALVAIAWTQPDLRVEIGERLAWRMLAGTTALRTRTVTILASLCRLTLACPWLQPDVLDLARDIVASLEEADAEEPADAREQEQQVVEASRRMGGAAGDKSAGKVLDDSPKQGRRLFGRRG